MFQRRLKLFLFILVIVSAALGIRATQIQVVQHDYLEQQGSRMAQRVEFIETTRGEILDRNGAVLAVDKPCIDACVDYRAIPEVPDQGWLTQVADANLRRRLSPADYRRATHGKETPLVTDELARLKADIAGMWVELAAVGKMTPDEMSEKRQEIVERVQMRKQARTWAAYNAAMMQSSGGQPWYRRLLSVHAGESGDIDDYEIELAEETQPHMILHDLDPETQARLAREQEQFFCLGLLPAKYRDYPQGEFACHVIGYVSPVKAEELSPADEASPADADQNRDLRGYRAEDVIGRAGLEALCEQTLRGSRGLIDESTLTGQTFNRIDPVPGTSVNTTIDIALEQDIEKEFLKRREHHDADTHQLLDTRFDQHGAAVVLDVKTNEVLAMVSCPAYDVRNLRQQYSAMAIDDLNRPLLNRATEMAVEPGSTVKPIVGAGAISAGLWSVEQKVTCNGYLNIGGRQIMDSHRCWTVALAAAHGIVPSHRLISGDPSLTPDDMLSVSDGIKHSCNVVFETIANKMTMGNLSYWYDRFGLGRPTGVGIEESPGRLYRPSDEYKNKIQPLTWSAGIGEGVVHATVMQMADVAATLARGGVWIRPRLISRDDQAENRTSPSDNAGPDTVDLGLSPQALQAVKTGMEGVCSQYGSGAYMMPDQIERGPDDPPLEQDPLLHMQIAGKTGSAQTGQLLKIYTRDPNGNIQRDEKGMPIYRQVQFNDPGTDGWYVAPPGPEPEKHVAHAWFMGYAPADHPQIAVCVLVEYGEAGGRVAGVIAHDILVDCCNHHYLSNK